MAFSVLQLMMLRPQTLDIYSKTYLAKKLNKELLQFVQIQEEGKHQRVFLLLTSMRCSLVLQRIHKLVLLREQKNNLKVIIKLIPMASVLNGCLF